MLTKKKKTQKLSLAESSGGKVPKLFELERAGASLNKP